VIGRDALLKDVEGAVSEPTALSIFCCLTSLPPGHFGATEFKKRLDHSDLTGEQHHAADHSGCRTGANTLSFASQDHKVLGLDFLAEPIQQAKRKAAERGVPATCLVKDATTLKDWSKRFDNVIDSGLFRIFSDDDRRYVEGLARVLRPAGRLFLLCFSDEEPGTQGPRRVSKKEPHDALAEGWSIESIQPSWFEVRPDLKDLTFSEGGPRAWFVVVRRAG
jgi:SAM-dependent methyltransferase